MSDQTSPRLLANSDAMVRHAEQGDDRTVWVTEQGSGYDEGHPVYVASSSDPLVNVTCTRYCDAAHPAQIRIPAKARPGDGGDGHIAVIQPDGTEFDTWATTMPSRDWQNGDTITSMNAVTCGSYATGTGFLGSSGASTVGGACLAGGLIRYSEIATGEIDHALFTTVDCATRSFYVYPAPQPFDSQCTGGGPDVPNGAHLWLDLSDAQVAALPVTAWEKTVLRALHHYGAYVLDSGSGADRAHGLFVPWWEDDAQYSSMGKTNPLVQWAASQGWNPNSVAPRNGTFRSTTRYTFSDSWNPLTSIGGWAAHLHVVDPCYAQGTC